MRLLTSPNQTPERHAMSQAAKRAGFRNVEVPYRASLTPRPHDTLYGGVLWCDVLSSHLGLNLLETPLDWLSTAPYPLTGRAITLTTPQEIWDHDDSETFDPQIYFYKPLDGKAPQPALYRRGEFPRGIEPDLPILRQGALDISLEVRAFVLCGEIRTASLYALHARPFTTPMPDGQDFTSLMELAHEAAKTSCHATVMDFALTQQNRWVVLEQNAAWSSALYGCDPDRAFEVVRASCTYDHSPWAREHVQVT